MSNTAVWEAALAFSLTMRRYSAREHVPHAIIADRSAIVWVEASPRLIRVAEAERRRRFGMPKAWGAAR